MSNIGGPSFAEIMSVGSNPYSGFAAGPGQGGFGGIDGPDVPYVSWAPRGASYDQTGPAAFLNNGVAPTSHGHISIKSLDFVQRQYLCPPWGDDSQQYIMPDMLVFSVNEMDPTEDSTTILTLSKANQLMREAYTDFVDASDPAHPSFFAEAGAFKVALEEYGEAMLESYHVARQLNKETAFRKQFEAEAGFAKFRAFYDACKTDMFCWLTRFGITQKMSFLGSVINVNRATSLESMDMTQHTDHYCQVNVCLAKRGLVANVFGHSDVITTGSRLWLTLKRKQRYARGGEMKPAEYTIVPNGSAIRDGPSLAERAYQDPSGRAMRGHYWRVGVVITPGNFDPSDTAMVTAANIGVQCNERRAYEDHGTLPTMYVAMGFK